MRQINEKKFKNRVDLNLLIIHYIIHKIITFMKYQTLCYQSVGHQKPYPIFCSE